MIKNLIFDFGKVLVDYDFDLLFQRIFPDPRQRKSISRFIADPSVVAVMDRGGKDFSQIIDDMARDYPEIAEELHVFCCRKPEVVIGEVPGMRELLARLKSEGYRLYGLTNWDTQVYITMDQFGIFDLLDGRIISSEEHCIKPEPQIYRRLFERYSLKPEECVFADDKAENIEGARREGMPGIVFRNAAQYETELRSMIDSFR